MPIELINKVTAEYYELAFPDQQTEDQRLTIPKTFSGMLSQITPEAAEIYIKMGGNLLVPKAAPKKATPASAKDN